MARIDRGFNDTIEAMRQSRHRLRTLIRDTSEAVSACFARGGKVLICGNGGSAADAQHFAGELVGRFRSAERPGLPAIALNADTAVLTAWSNDAGYDDVFARQVQALGRGGDILIGISTSGRATNIVQAFEMARRRGVHTIGILGGDGGVVRGLADTAIVVPAKDTQRIQEVHILVIHLLCELIEERLFGAHAAHVVPQRPARLTAGAARRLEIGAQEWRVRGRAALDRFDKNGADA
jgi:phosphoheptose isomerase